METTSVKLLATAHQSYTHLLEVADPMAEKACPVVEACRVGVGLARRRKELETLQWQGRNDAAGN